MMMCSAGGAYRAMNKLNIRPSCVKEEFFQDDDFLDDDITVMDQQPFSDESVLTVDS